MQAADYSATTQYLKAVKATGTDDPDKVMAYLRKTKINDMYAKNGYIRADGSMIHDMYLDAGQGTDRVQVSLGLLQGRANHPRRTGVHHQGGNGLRAVEVRRLRLPLRRAEGSLFINLPAGDFVMVP